MAVRAAVVQLLGVPVDLFLESEQHTSDLLRETNYVLAEHDLPPESIYHRFLRTAIAANMSTMSARTETGDQVEAAQRRGVATVDLEMPAVEAVAAMTELWCGLLDELDAESRAGRLLALPASPDAARLRRWYVEQITGQVRRADPPVPFD